MTQKKRVKTRRMMKVPLMMKTIRKRMLAQMRNKNKRFRKRIPTRIRKPMILLKLNLCNKNRKILRVSLCMR